tara:strand:+ start:3507 stop:4937 length:1431 start_codon:yes stop_codon:yes gene_type:complete
MVRQLFLLLMFQFAAIILFSQASEIDEITSLSTSLDSAEQYIVSEIIIIGNKKTKDYIIAREITAQIGDTLSGKELSEELEQSRKNVLNTLLFHFAKISLIPEGNYVKVYVLVTERWYFFPVPIFEIDDNNINTWLEDVDWNRLNYGAFLTLKNIGGRDETMRLTFQLGYRERLRLSYAIPYINKSRTLGLSFAGSFLRRREIPYLSFENKRLEYRDEDEYVYQSSAAGISLNYRKKIFNRHSMQLNYNNVLVSDTIFGLNPNYLEDQQTRNEYLVLTYSFLRDRRDSKNYPLSGHLLAASIQKIGLGVFKHSPNFINTTMQARKFKKLNDRFSIAGSASATFSLNDDTPYFLENGTGYSGGVRGYEYYVIDGQDIGVAKIQFRYNLLRPRIYKIPLVPTEKFNRMHFAIYSSVFSDFGYVNDDKGYPSNDLANTLLFGTGVSLDFVTYYDMVLRTEYSFNKLGESGLFIHFVAPI